MQVRLRFGLVALHLRRKSWHETRVLETLRFTFGGSLVRNARFGDLALHFWRKSRTKRSFWRLGASLLEEVLARNARFGDFALHFWRKSRTKRSFWRLGASLLEEVSYETLVLETWRFTFRGSLERNAHFGWRFTCGQTWPVCSANVVRERAFRSWTQKWPVCSTNVARSFLELDSEVASL